MEDNRRSNFRAPVVEAVEASLFIGRAELTVRVVEESSGGLTVVTEDIPTFPQNTEGMLRTDDGRSLPVRVAHYRRRGMTYQIGLQRKEAVPLNTFDLRKAFAAPERTTISPLWYAAIVLIGLALGLAMRNDFVSRVLSALDLR